MELKLLLFRLASLANVAADFIFVEDGRNRPEEKRGTRVYTCGHWLVEGMKKMVGAFGFKWHVVSAAISLP